MLWKSDPHFSSGSEARRTFAENHKTFAMSQETLPVLSDRLLRSIANTIRGLSMDAVQKANSGHPGLPMGMADVAAVLWSEFLEFNPANPRWFDRDRFVLSGGHGSMLLYSLLYLYGYELTLEDLKAFRQWHSKTPGHPEYRDTPGVETTTGPLGQGIGNAVGMALAEASLAARYNSAGSEIVNHHTYVMCGDGDLEEGISHEACSFAGHQRLGKLIMLYDDNEITIDGPTDLSFTEDVLKRYEAYGWHVQRIDGHHYGEIRRAIQAAKEETERPSIIACRTIIGFGSPNKAGTHDVHGAPLGEEEVKLTKEALGLPANESFYVPEEVLTFTRGFLDRGRELEMDWQERLLVAPNKDAFKKCLTEEISAEALNIPAFDPGKDMATRAASGKVLDYLASRIPALMGGSADLSPSNKTFPKGETAFEPNRREGRYIHYGVREHAMASIMNGLSLHGGVIPYGGTFFVFTDYMRPAMRLAALMQIRSIYVLTHDSIGLGEDGPTHQPIEHLSSLRCMPNMSVIRPMDAAETAEAWKQALRRKDGPTCLVLTRQKVPEYDRKALGFAPASELSKGGYVLTEDEGYESIIIATGSEVSIALEAKKLLNEKGLKVRIVAMPSTDLFDKQDEAYRNSVLPKDKIRRVAVEAGSSQSWYKYVGLSGKVVGLDHFGASAPFGKLYSAFGLTAEHVAEAVFSGQ